MQTDTVGESNTNQIVNCDLGHSSTTHLWFCGYPGFNTQVISFAESLSSLAAPSQLAIYDADGFLVSEARVAFGNDNPGVFDLEALTSGCKLESGLKHGHLVITSPAGVRHQSRLTSMRDAWINNSAKIINKRNELFYPLRFAPDRSSFVALVNQSAELAEVRIRTFCGSRSPRTDLQVPGMGARIFNLDSLFPEYGYTQDQALNAYVRLTSRVGGSVSCFFMDRLLEKADSDIFQTIC